MSSVDFLPVKPRPAVWTRPRIYSLNRSIICAVVLVSMGTLFLRPGNFLQYTFDTLLRTYLMFIGTVMAHEGVHGHLGRTRTVNLRWGSFALLPTMVPYTNFRKTHHLHHGHTNIPGEDPDHFMKSRNLIELVLRALAMPHQWFFWLWKRGRIRRRDLLELSLNYLFIFAVYGAILAQVGASRLFWGMAPPLILVSVLLWFPFAVQTHEGFSTGEAALRSHNYYGRFMYWFSLGLAIHRQHHLQPKLSWIELKEYVEDAPVAGRKLLRFPQRDIRLGLPNHDSQAISNGRLSLIDRVFSIMDSPSRPRDFAVLLHLKNAPNLEALSAGASSARNLYPTTGSNIDKQHWVRCSEPSDGISATSVSSTAEMAKVIEEFVDSPFDLHQLMPVQQLLVMDGLKGETKLVTRFHHIAADGLSAALWLGHQFRVAFEKESPVIEVSPFENLLLRSHASPVKRSRFAYRGPSHPLWTRHTERSRARRWRTIEVDGADLHESCRRVGGFTYNDLLATCALQVFTQWNRSHCNGRRQRVGLWLPVNIRQRRVSSFGNGTSRVRLYAQYDDRASLLDQCREIRRQLFWSNRHGEWAVPTDFPLASWPSWATSSLVRAYLNRPGIDMATGVFSHAETALGGSDEIFEHVEKIESIGLLHARHSLAINGATRGGRTWLTFTYDLGLLSTEDIEHLVEMYREQITLARREFA